MKDYTSGEPAFSSVIKIVETTDPAHADNINMAPKQLLQNTIANRNVLNGLFGFTYEGNGVLYNILGCSLDGETLIIPASMAAVEDETLCLTGGIPFSSESGGSTAEYVLPVATDTQLGGVKIGNGIDSASDGTISVDKTELLDEVTAEESDTEEMLADVFGKTQA